MKKIQYKNYIFALFTGVNVALSQGVPSSEEIYNSATNFWRSNNISGFTTYTTNLYSGVATNYVAPVLLSAFYDYVFLGELVSASNKYARVSSNANNSPEQFSSLFKGLLSMSLKFVESDIKMYNDENKPLDDAKSLANPQLICNEDANSNFILPDLYIIKHAPNIQLK